MVDAFKMNQDGFRPHLKLGHNKEQALLAADGLPAAGWIGDVFRRGDKLLANFIDIPDKIFKILEGKVFRKVSAEIFFDVKIGDTFHKHMLGAVALLGADNPGVMNLSDILSQFGLTGHSELKSYIDSEIKTKVYDFNSNDNLEGPMPKSEKEIQLEVELNQSKDALQALQKEQKDYTASKEEADKNIETLVKEKEELSKKVFETEKKATEAVLQSNVDKLLSTKLISKSQKELALAILGPELKAYTVGDKKDATKYDLLKEFATLSKKNSTVNFDDNSEEGKQDTGVTDADIKKYSKDNDVTYGDAYSELMKGKLSIDKASLEKED